MRKAALVAISLIAAGCFAAGASANKPGAAQCWASSSEVAIGSSYNISASGLPSNGTVNLVVFYPDGGRLTTPVSNSDGSFSMQASTGSTFQAAEAGSYTFKFVGKVSWPSGSWSKEYATCSMQAN
jgi:hypothetical protein